MSKVSILLLFAFPYLCFAADPLPTMKVSLAKSEQLLVVITADWDAVPGTLLRFERRNVTSNWRQVGGPVSITVGRKGLGWGKGLHPEQLGNPIKAEGDGKSPAGIFTLSSAFGLVPAKEMTKLKVPYRFLTREIECVDDAASPHYNSILNRGDIAKPDWNSSEKMSTYTVEYHLGVVVDHNAGRQSGCGSCIFLHVWKGPGMGTSGCTAMPLKDMEEIVRWLDSGKKPALVQLPNGEYERLTKKWELPQATAAKQY